MKSKTILHCLLFLCLSFFLTGCTSSFHKTQITFGIKAAQDSLWDEAIFRWKKVSDSNPKSVAAHNNLAVAYEKKGLLEEAEKEYSIAKKLGPNNKYVQSNYEKFKKRHREQKKEKDEKN